jgi:hypothetical protein
VRFRLIDAAKKEFPVRRTCEVLGMRASGYFTWKERPAYRRQHDYMVLLAHVRTAFCPVERDLRQPAGWCMSYTAMGFRSAAGALPN